MRKVSLRAFRRSAWPAGGFVPMVCFARVALYGLNWRWLSRANRPVGP
jgi:hypothetical protein